MKNEAAVVPQLCRKFHRASELIGRRWTGAIIYVLLAARCRFAVLREAIPDITDRMLSDRLQELEAEDIVERIVVPDTPVRVEYALTRKGRALADVMHEISSWADAWLEVNPPASVKLSDRGRRTRPPQRRRGSVARSRTSPDR